MLSKEQVPALSKAEVLHIAKLARVKLSDEELARFQREFSSILDYFEVLKELDTVGVEPLTHSVEVRNEIREDVPKKAAPMQEGFLKTKQVFSSP